MEGDVVVEKLMLDRSWQMRRVQWSKETIYFKRLEGDNVIDSIPLAEIDEIVCASDFESKTGRDRSTVPEPPQDHDSPSQVVKNSFSSFTQMLKSENAFKGVFGAPFCGLFAKPTLSNGKIPDKTSQQGESPVLHIRTIPGGFNSGRAYCLRVRSDTDRENMFTMLSRSVKLAKRKDRTKTQLNRWHKHIRAFYYSSEFQFAISMLIFTVLHPPCNDFDCRVHLRSPSSRISSLPSLRRNSIESCWTRTVPRQGWATCSTPSTSSSSAAFRWSW